MESQPVEDVYSTRSWQNTATINLEPDFSTNSKSNWTINEVNGNNYVNELKFNIYENYIRPEAARGKFGGRQSGRSRGRRGGNSGRRSGGREGVRKRHPNFAARNRKIGKGGPTGRGAFSGLKKRRPTGPRPPDNSGSEPEGYEQDVDPKTGRTKRRQRPKSAEAEAKAKQRKDEDEVRKSSKKKRPGPKQKDESEMKEKVKRFWRETPKPKDKKAPRFIAEGLESEKEREKVEPEDFDDLRMPSKKQLKKLEKAKKKEAQRRQKKSERGSITAKAEERIIEGDYVPTLSELEGIEGDYNAFMREAELYDGKESPGKSSQKLRLKLKPKKSGKEYKTFQDDKLKRSLSDIEKDYKSFLEQQTNFTNLNENLMDLKRDISFNEIYRKSGDESEEKEENAKQSEHVIGWDKADEEDTDLNMKAEETDKKADQDKYWSDYRRKATKLMKKRSKFIPGSKIHNRKLDNLNVKSDNGKPNNFSDIKFRGSLDETQQFGDNQSDYESKNDLNVLDKQSSTTEYDEDFDRVYEDIKEYINKESEIDDKNEKEDPTLEGGSRNEEFQTASDEDEIWDKVQRRFRKPIKKKKKLSATIKIKGYDGRIYSEDRTSKGKNDPLLTRFNGKHTDHLIEESAKLSKTILEKEDLPETFDEEGSDHSVYSTKEEIHSESDWENKWDLKLKKQIAETSENTLGSDLMGRNIKQSLETKENRLKKLNKLGLAKTGSVVDEKLEAIYKDLKELNGQINKNEFLDDVGQLLYNDDDEMFKLQGESSCDDQQDENLRGHYEKDFNLEDYKNYVEILPGSKLAGESVHGSKKPGVKDIDERMESAEESETPDSAEDKKNSESEREEYDLALMAGLRSDRIRVFDQNVEMYAHQDHQAKQFEIQESSAAHKTLSDFEYERAIKNGGLLGTKPCDDDVLVLTETEDPKSKRRKSLRKKSNEKKVISSECDEDDISREINYTDMDQLLVDKSELPLTRDNAQGGITPESSPDKEQPLSIIPGKSTDMEVSEFDETVFRERENLGDLIDQKNKELNHTMSLKCEELLQTKAVGSKFTEVQELKEPITLHKFRTETSIPTFEDKNETTELSTTEITDSKTTDVPPLHKTASQEVVQDFDIFGGELDDDEEKDEEDEENEEESKYKDNEFLKREWSQFVTNVGECFGDTIDLPKELPDDCPSEEEEEEEEEHNKYDKTLISTSPTESQSSKVSLKDSEKTQSKQHEDSTTSSAIVMEDLTRMEIIKEEEESKDVISSQNITGQPFKLKKGINEYLEEDKWDLWYKFIALMNNNETRSYDNCAALFKAKKQEILTRTKAPIPPWEEPGIDEYERDRRKVQREWEKTERYHALRSQEGFNEFLYENEGIPLKDEWDPELEESYRFIFDLIDPNFKYDHQAYKDSLSREELAEVYSENEVEEEIRNRELCKQGKDLESEVKKAEASGDVSFSQIPPLDHTHNLLQSVFLNQPNTEFCQYDTVPEWTKNDLTNPVNYKVYSNKMNAELESSKFTQNTNEQTELVNEPTNNQDIVNSDTYNYKENLSNGGVNIISSANNDHSFEYLEKPINVASFSSETNDGNKSQLSKGEQAKKMWQYFLQLMRERHEKSIEKFLSLQPPIKKSSEEEARRLWKQYVAFTSNQPMPKKISDDRSATFTRDEMAKQTRDSIGNAEKILDTKEATQDKQQHVRSFWPDSEKGKELPSEGWRTLLQRIQAMKMDSNASTYPHAAPSQQVAKGQPRQTQDNLRAEPPFQEGRYHNETPPSWGPASEQYRPSPAPYGTPETYPRQQTQGQYTNPYGHQGQGYVESSRRPPPRGPRGDPYYGPPMYGYEYPVPGAQQPRGLEGMNQYHSQFVGQRGDYTDPYGKPLPPNASLNRAYNTPEMGFQNPDFTRAMDDRTTYMANQADPYTANRSRVGWPGDHSDKFHNRKYFISDMGGQQTYIPRDLSMQPGDHSDKYYNRSNFRNPNFGYRTDTYSRQPFEREPINERSIRWWQSGTRPLASSGLQSGPTINTETGDRLHDPYVTEKQDHTHFTAPRDDSNWPPQSFPSQNDQAGHGQSSMQSKLSTESNKIQPEE